MNQYIYNFANRLVNSFSSIVFVIILGNTLSQEEVGIYSLVLLASAYAISLLTLKINPSIIQRLNDTKNKNLLNQYFTAGLISTLAFSVLIVFIYYTFSNMIMDGFNLENKNFIYLASFLAFTLTIRGYVDHILMSLLQNKYLFFISSIAFIVNIISYFILANIYSSSIEVAIYSIYIANILYVVMGTFKIFQYYKFLIDKNILLCIKSIMTFSFIVYFVSLADFMNSNIALLIINQHLGKEDVAVYNYAIKIAMLFLIIGASISNVNYPKMTKLFSENKIDEISNLLTVTLKMNFYLILICSIIFLSISNEIIALILPPEYQSMVGLLFIMLPGIILFSGFMAIKSLFNALNMPSVGLLIVWGSLILNVIFSLILVPKYGLYGGAVSTIISFLFNPLCIIFLIKIKTDFVIDFRFLYLIFPFYLISVYLVYLYQSEIGIKLVISMVFILFASLITNPIKIYRRYKK